MKRGEQSRWWLISPWGCQRAYCKAATDEYERFLKQNNAEHGIPLWMAMIGSVYDMGGEPWVYKLRQL